MSDLIKKSLDKGVDSVQEFCLRNSSDSISFKDGKLKDIKSSDICGNALTVKKDGKEGSVYYSEASDKEKVVENILDVVKYGQRSEYDFQKNTELEKLSLYYEETEKADIKDFIPQCEEIVKFIKNIDDRLNISGGVGKDIQYRRIKNSNDVHFEDKKTEFGIGFSASITTATDIFELSYGISSLKTDIDIEKIKNEIKDKYEKGINIKEFKPSKVPVYLTPNAVTQSLMAISGIKGSSVYTGISPLKDKINKQIFSEKITISDNSLYEDGKMSHIFDDEGTPGQNTILVEKGVLKSFLMNRLNAARLNLEPTSNGLRNKHIFNTKEYTLGAGENFTNIFIEPGNDSYEDLIGSIKDGIIIDSMFGMIMGNIVAGDINTNIDYGYRVINGKIVGRIKNCSIGCNIYEIFMNNIAGIENKIHFESGMNGSYYIPGILLKDIYIS